MREGRKIVDGCLQRKNIHKIININEEPFSNRKLTQSM